MKDGGGGREKGRGERRPKTKEARTEVWELGRGIQTVRMLSLE